VNGGIKRVKLTAQTEALQAGTLALTASLRPLGTGPNYGLGLAPQEIVLTAAAVVPGGGLGIFSLVFDFADLSAIGDPRIDRELDLHLSLAGNPPGGALGG
jgi:hypothetical protein